MASNSALPIGPALVIFRLPDEKHDTRLTVFNKTFHVHSVLLKLHSRFFRKFLDSPDKIPAPATAEFRYDWVSVVDDDGEWGLQAVSPSASVDSIKQATKSLSSSRQTGEEQSFAILLCAMYNRPYSIPTVSVLEDVTRLADYYCALPILSATLNSVLFSCQFSLCANIADNSENCLLAAYRLRNRILFREALVYIISNWATDHVCSEIQENGRLYELLKSAYGELAQRLAKTNHALMAYSLSSPVFSGLVKECASIWLNRDNYMETAYFYRNLRESIKGRVFLGLDGCIDLLDDLVADNRSLGKLVGADNILVSEHVFLCAEISDEDLPWDVNQTDW